MSWRTLLEEKETPGRYSMSRALMALGGIAFGLMTLGFGAWSLIFALPRLLSGDWTPAESVVALGMLETYRHGVSLSAAMAAPYALRKLADKIPGLKG